MSSTINRQKWHIKNSIPHKMAKYIYYKYILIDDI